MPKRYRLIPIDVEAIKITPESVERAARWVGGFEVTEFDPLDSTLKFVALNVPTATEIMRAQEGDYVVKDLRGRVSVVKGSDFESKYELI